MHIKQERRMDDDNEQYSRPSSIPWESNIPYSVTNENWQGKNDPTERRRLQNRINQRKFRERQRAGEPKQQYKPRSTSGGSSSRQRKSQTPPEYDEDEGHDEDQFLSACVTSAPSITVDNSTGCRWDELGLLINRNFMHAAYTNARSIGIKDRDLQRGHSMLTPRPSLNTIPAALLPIKQQHEIAHDPIIDIIPHARLRYNILGAISAGYMDAAAFASSLRASGARINASEPAQRGGVVIWGNSPGELSSWELSEMFVQRWGFLLQGCEDLLAATNSWRSQRGERLFPASLPAR